MKDIKDLKRYEVVRDNIGVYFLHKGDDIVYVGQSTNVWGRVQVHIREGVKDFDSYSVLPCSEDRLLRTELFYIYILQPKYNKRLDGFCNKSIFIKKIQEEFELPFKKSWAELAIKESGIEAYCFKGVEYFANKDLNSVIRTILSEDFYDSAIKKAA